MEILTPILEIAKEILQEAGQKGLHVKEITDKAIVINKNMGLNAEDFQRKLQTALLGNIKLKQKSPTFATVCHTQGARKGKPKQGYYRLKIRRETKQAFQVFIPQIPTIFLGKAGEYAVMSELLFHGFNTSVMTVDDGIDLVASKEDKFFKLQVKTAQQQVQNKYQFTISKKSFIKYNSADVFYIFVLRNLGKNDFIIIPSTQINYFINANIIQVGAEKISFSINYDEKNKKYLINNRADIQQYFRNFGEIR